MVTAIVLSSHTAGLGVIRALGAKGVPVIAFYYDKNDMGYVSKHVQKKVNISHPGQNQESILGQLTECAKSHGRCFLVPADDVALTFLSKNKGTLQENFWVACTDWRIAEKFINKVYTYEMAERHGIPHPKTFFPKSLAELESCEKGITYPCLIKPCQSHCYAAIFKKKLAKAADRDQLYEAYSEAHDAGIEVMLQEYIPGEDSGNTNYNSYFWGDRPLVEFTAQKIRLYPPDIGVPCVVRSCHVREVVEPGRKILTALGYYGYSCTEFKRDARDGTYKLMDINGRHNRSSLLSVACGINFPWLEYRHLVYGEIPEQHSFHEGVFWIDEVKDIVQFLAGAGRKGRLSEFLEPYKRECIFSVFDSNDVLPICKRITNLFSRFVQAK